jgi:hypothetical protein
MTQPHITNMAASVRQRFVFLLPPIEAVAARLDFNATWPAGGPWVSPQTGGIT